MKSVCVYCGSSDGNQPDFREAAVLLGEVLVKKRISLVYGGASIGLMGALADTVLQGGGEVFGVIPRALAKKEVAHHGLTELHVVDSMHSRKAMMAELSDGFIALPGGLGTLEELFETLTWAQLGLHRKPSALLNVNGFYDQLTGFLEQAVNNQFIRRENLDMLLVDESADSLVERMNKYTPPTVSKVLSSSES